MIITNEELIKAKASAQRCRDNSGECAAWANQVIVLITEVQQLRSVLERLADNSALTSEGTTAEADPDDELDARMHTARKALNGFTTVTVMWFTALAVLTAGLIFFHYLRELAL